MQIRRLREGNEEAACRVIEEVKFVADGLVGVSADAGYMRTFLADDRNYLIIATVDDKPVGFVLGYECARVDGPRSMMFLYEIGVEETHRRKGIGRALIEELKRCCVARGCCKMFVPTSASNKAAMALYRSADGKGGADPDAATFGWSW
jgi:ribosomal protein S18 acetylase RimI-like enzyme